MNILENIAAKTKTRVEAEKEVLSVSEIQKILEEKFSNNSESTFLEYFSDNDLNIISEIKLASPSLGDISNLNPVDVAEMYLNNGAKALSVLTEPFYFKGNIDYISQIKDQFSQSKLLMKDFVVNEYQIYKAKAFGANAILLITALLNKKQLIDYQEICKNLGLSTLVEVHDEDEMKIALDTGAKLIGVNNRNLKDLSITLKTSEELVSLVNSEITLISESGLKTHDDLTHLKQLGYKGFLIGTSFMKTDNPGQALAEILKG